MHSAKGPTAKAGGSSRKSREAAQEYLMIGPGKYDDICTLAREKAEAIGAIVIIFEGKHGHGFSCQLPPSAISGMPGILRQVAKEIEDGE